MARELVLLSKTKYEMLTSGVQEVKTNNEKQNDVDIEKPDRDDEIEKGDTEVPNQRDETRDFTRTKTSDTARKTIQNLRRSMRKRKDQRGGQSYVETKPSLFLKALPVNQPKKALPVTQPKKVLPINQQKKKWLSFKI